MKAWEMTQSGWSLVERSERVPGPGEVVVQIKAASLNYRDLAFTRLAAAGHFGRPIIPVSDGAGEVLETGPAVTRVTVGQPVVACFFGSGWLDGERMPGKVAGALGSAGADGVLAERVVLHEDALLPIPAGLTYAEAATLPCAALTAWNAYFDTNHLKPGDVVLLQGTGGVSVFGLQLAKLAGARVIITSSSDEKLARARQLGADECINYKSTPDWDARALALTGGAGVDIILEVGGRNTQALSVRATRPGGAIQLIGGLTGYEHDPNLRDAATAKGVRVNEIYVGSRGQFEDMNRAILFHHLHPVIDRVFSFAQANQALDYMASGSHFGKIVIAG
jgi:NADPH:quinone reductase-like Zn-dependent oxidoreductase